MEREASAERSPFDLVQQRTALAFWKPLYRVAKRRARNGWTIRAEVPLEPRRVRLSGLAQQPSDRFLYEIFLVAVQPFGDLVARVARETDSDGRNEADGSRPPNPHVAT